MLDSVNWLNGKNQQGRECALLDARHSMWNYLTDLWLTPSAWQSWGRWRSPKYRALLKEPRAEDQLRSQVKWRLVFLPWPIISLQGSLKGGVGVWLCVCWSQSTPVTVTLRSSMQVGYSLSPAQLPLRLLFHGSILRQVFRVLNTEFSFGWRSHNLEITDFVTSLSKRTGK